MIATTSARPRSKAVLAGGFAGSVLAGVVLAACGTSGAAGPAAGARGPASPPSPSSPVAAKPAGGFVGEIVDPPAAPPPKGPVAAYTDPRVVAALAATCRWAPGAADAAEDGPGPLSCDAEMDQSCVYDPCFEESESSCKGACRSTCESCDARCAGGCAPCAAKCRDDACRLACARETAACRQGCLETKDRCASAGCQATYEACNRKLLSDWKASGCGAVCAKYGACTEACLGKDDDPSACFARCRGRFARTCPTRLLELCGPMGSGPPGTAAP